MSFLQNINLMKIYNFLYLRGRAIAYLLNNNDLKRTYGF